MCDTDDRDMIWLVFRGKISVGIAKISGSGMIRTPLAANLLFAPVTKLIQTTGEEASRLKLARWTVAKLHVSLGRRYRR